MKESVTYVDVNEVARQFWQEANIGNDLLDVKVDVEERTVTNSESQSDLNNKKTFQWIGKGDELINKSKLIQQPQDANLTQLAFEPQRIRSFMVTYTVLKKEQKPVQSSSLVETQSDTQQQDEADMSAQQSDHDFELV